jgi:protein TonB
MAELMKFIGKNIKYPANARRMEIQGQVFISFVVNADGTIGDIETVKGVFADLDSEAKRVIGKMPTWKPGRQDGKAVRVKFVLPIKFKLGDS